MGKVKEDDLYDFTRLRQGVLYFLQFQRVPHCVAMPQVLGCHASLVPYENRYVAEGGQLLSVPNIFRRPWHGTHDEFRRMVFARVVALQEAMNITPMEKEEAVAAAKASHAALKHSEGDDFTWLTDQLVGQSSLAVELDEKHLEIGEKFRKYISENKIPISNGKEGGSYASGCYQFYGGFTASSQASTSADVKADAMFWVRGPEDDVAMTKPPAEPCRGPLRLRREQVDQQTAEHVDQQTAGDVEGRTVAYFLQELALHRRTLASVSTYSDIRLRYVPKLSNGSEKDGDYADLWRLLYPLLKLYNDNHKGPPLPKEVRFLGFEHITNVTITVTGYEEFSVITHHVPEQ